VQAAKARQTARPVDRAAARAREVARAEAAYRSMPKLRSVTRGHKGGAGPVERPPTPPGGILGHRPPVRPPEPPGAPWENPRPPTPAPGRVPFDTLFTDPRRLRGDLRLVRRAIRSDSVPLADRPALFDEICELMKADNEHGKHKGEFRAARLMISVVRALLDIEIHNQRVDRIEFRQEHGLGQRGPIPYGRLHLTRRFDVWEHDGLPPGLEPARALSIFTRGDGTSFSIELVRPAAPQRSLWFYLCPRCRRRCRYLYPGRGMVVCSTCRTQ